MRCQSVRRVWQRYSRSTGSREAGTSQVRPGDSVWGQRSHPETARYMEKHVRPVTIVTRLAELNVISTISFDGDIHFRLHCKLSFNCDKVENFILRILLKSFYVLLLRPQ